MACWRASTAPARRPEQASTIGAQEDRRRCAPATVDACRARAARRSAPAAPRRDRAQPGVCRQAGPGASRRRRHERPAPRRVALRIRRLDRGRVLVDDRQLPEEGLALEQVVQLRGALAELLVEVRLVASRNGHASPSTARARREVQRARGSVSAWSSSAARRIASLIERVGRVERRGSLPPRCRGRSPASARARPRATSAPGSRSRCERCQRPRGRRPRPCRPPSRMCLATDAGSSSGASVPNVSLNAAARLDDLVEVDALLRAGTRRRGRGCCSRRSSFASGPVAPSKVWPLLVTSIAPARSSESTNRRTTSKSQPNGSVANSSARYLPGGRLAVAGAAARFARRPRARGPCSASITTLPALGADAGRGSRTPAAGPGGSSAMSRASRPFLTSASWPRPRRSGRRPRARRCRGSRLAARPTSVEPAAGLRSLPRKKTLPFEERLARRRRSSS